MPDNIERTDGSSARLRFRRVTVEEALALVQESVVVREPFAEGYPDDGTRFFALRMLEHGTDDEDPLGMYHIIEHATGSRVGHIGFHGGSDAGQAVRIGYATASGARREGYASEAVAWLIKFAAAHASVSVLAADTTVDNLASQRVLESNGFALVRIDAGSRFYELSVR